MANMHLSNPKPERLTEADVMAYNTKFNSILDTSKTSVEIILFLKCLHPKHDKTSAEPS